ncbi:hypothetical protein PR048_019654 [Dryococelus australis]|uniref:Uncharacterized protein n=1 Tax=Dryococelus australis TaxID=614101 RepID=A0ABQ9H427_9NEOP|nr:hypothetical protein PR048_019654 [Dryococelus australis]
MQVNLQTAATLVDTMASHTFVQPTLVQMADIRRDPGVLHLATHDCTGASLGAADIAIQLRGQLSQTKEVMVDGLQEKMVLCQSWLEA